MLWFGAVAVGTKNVKDFRATIVDQRVPDYWAADFSYQQWGVAAQPTALSGDLVNKLGAYGTSCAFQGNSSFGVYNSAILARLATGPAITAVNGVGGSVARPSRGTPIPRGKFMVEENVEIFGRTSFAFGSVLKDPKRVDFVLEKKADSDLDQWKLQGAVRGTSIATALSFNQSAIVNVFDAAVAAGNLNPDSPEWSVAHSDEWKWVFMPYSWKAVPTQPTRLADVPRTFVNVSRYEDVSLELEGGAALHGELSFDDGMEITGKLFDGALDLNYTTLSRDWGRPSELNPVTDPKYPWRVCVVDSLLAYKRGSQAASKFDYATMRGSFEMRFEGSTDSDECPSGVCSPTIPTCTTGCWLRWCESTDPAPVWCQTASEL